MTPHRYELMRTADEYDEHLGRDVERTWHAGTYRWKWHAEWKAGRRSSAAATFGGGGARYWVRPEPPAVVPDAWESLTIIQSSSRLNPSATVTAGSTVVCYRLGITRWHALGRAARWAKPRSRQQVRISNWQGEPRPEPSHGGSAAE
ncbi:hypothetical protein [Gordonia sihwensis]|uniref:hypothetical protein n=1 Tax=Gordonia sihwensis TaxID=173559 RepID=UPI003D999D37